VEATAGVASDGHPTHMQHAFRRGDIPPFRSLELL